MKKLLFFFFLNLIVFISAQKQLHIEYLHVRSTIANVREDLYTNGVSVLSKQDGNIIWTNPSYKTDKKGTDRYFISKISSDDRNFFLTTQLDFSDINYFVYDNVPSIKWNIEKETSKTILGFSCKKATAVFRGSPITAYFSSEIPYSVGPFKFFGLPGAILDVRVDGKNYNLWKAVKVNLDDKSKVNYNPQFPDYTKAKMEDYVQLRESSISKNLDAAKVNGSTSKSVGERLGIEKSYEWEK